MENLGCVPARIGHVDMRIGAVSHHHVCQVNHLLCDVRMKVETGYERDCVTHYPAHATQQLALAVVEVFGDHSPVDIKKDAVEGTGRFEIVQHHADDPLIGIL